MCCVALTWPVGSCPSRLASWAPTTPASTIGLNGRTKRWLRPSQRSPARLAPASRVAGHAKPRVRRSFEDGPIRAMTQPNPVPELDEGGLLFVAMGDGAADGAVGLVRDPQWDAPPQLPEAAIAAAAALRPLMATVEASLNRGELGQNRTTLADVVVGVDAKLALPAWAPGTFRSRRSPLCATRVRMRPQLASKPWARHCRGTRSLRPPL